MLFPVGTPFDGPDNITVGPHGFALACTDGEDDQWLVGINDEGGVFPFAFNANSDRVRGRHVLARRPHAVRQSCRTPGWTYAIWGPWSGEQDGWKYD